MPGRGCTGGGGRGTLAQLDPLALVGLEPALVFFFFPPFPPAKTEERFERHNQGKLDCKRKSIKNWRTSEEAVKTAVAAFGVWQMCVRKKLNLVQTWFLGYRSIWPHFQRYNFKHEYSVGSCLSVLTQKHSRLPDEKRTSIDWLGGKSQISIETGENGSKRCWGRPLCSTHSSVSPFTPGFGFPNEISHFTASS